MGPQQRREVRAARHRQLPHAAEPPGVSPQGAGPDGGAEPGLPGRGARFLLVRKAAHAAADHQRVSQVPVRARSRGARGDAALDFASVASMVITLRSILFNLLYGLWTAGMHIICLPLIFASPRTVQAAGAVWIDGTLWLLKHVVGIDHRIVGAEHLPTTPAIFASKHQSAWETLFLSRYLNFPAFVLKKELLSIPLFGWFLRRAGMIAIDRKAGASALRQMSREATSTLEAG